jgi:hypothetical protein
MSQLVKSPAPAQFNRPTPAAPESIPFDRDAREQTRWKEIAAGCFSVAVICLGLVFVTQNAWFILGVLLFCPGAMIIMVIDIALRLDDNTPLTIAEVKG